MSNKTEKLNQVTVLPGVSTPNGEAEKPAEKVVPPPPASDEEDRWDDSHLSDVRHARQSTRPRDRKIPH